MSQSRSERRANERAQRKSWATGSSSLSATKKTSKAAWRGMLLVGVLGLFTGGFGVRLFSSQTSAIETSVTVASAPAALEQPSLSELCEMSNEALSQVDLGYINLLCSEGLHASSKNALSKNLAILDRITATVREQTALNMRRWFEKPEEYENSDAYFKVGMMVSILAQDFGVHYKEDKIAKPSIEMLQDKSFYDDADDVFIRGCLGPGKAGTCSSMPVLAVAIGRRLGYPLKLVGAKAHLFFRWDDDREKRNFEYTNGVVCSPDDYYRKWPFPITEWEEKQGWYLHSLTPQQELAIFLNARGMVFHRHQKYGLALVAHSQATVLWPRTRDLGMCLASSSEAHLHEMGFHRTSDEFAKTSVPRDPHDPFAEVREVMEINRLNAAKYPIPTNQRQSPSLFPRSRN